MRIPRFINSIHQKNTLRNISRILADQLIVLVDIGAAGGVEPRWKPIASKISFIGFEPDERSFHSILQEENIFAARKIIQSAIWNVDGEIEINLCKKPKVSSCFKPNYDFIARFPKADRFDIAKKVKVSTNRLDSLDLGNGDFLKLDIQGGELAALQGGPVMLKGAFGLEVEVEFLKIYQDQPLFGEICEHLAQYGFEFIDFTTLTRWGRKKRIDPGKGQCTFGNALFLKSPEMIKSMLDQEKINTSDVRRYLAILTLYRRADLLEICIDIFTDSPIYDEDLLNDLRYVTRATNSTIRKMKWLTNASNFLLKMIGGNMRFQIHF